MTYFKKIGILVLISLGILFSCTEPISNMEIENEKVEIADSSQQIEELSFPLELELKNRVFKKYWLYKDSVYSSTDTIGNATMLFISDSSIVFNDYRDTVIFPAPIYSSADSVFPHSFIKNAGHGQEVYEIKGKKITVLRESYWRCSDPFCGHRHGHENSNSTSFIDFGYGILCHFSQLEKDQVEILYSVDGEKVEGNLILSILEKYQLSEQVVNTIKGDL